MNSYTDKNHSLISNSHCHDSQKWKTPESRCYFNFKLQHFESTRGTNGHPASVLTPSASLMKEDKVKSFELFCGAIIVSRETDV